LPDGLLSSPLTAECGIDDDALVIEGLGDVTRASELSGWLAPTCRSWVSAEDVSWDSTSLKVPDTDSIGVPLSGIYSTSDIIKAIAVGVRVRRLNTASNILALAWRIDIAVGGFHRSYKGPSIRNAASWGSVKRHGVATLRIHPFNDIYLAIVRPVWSNCPECRPRSTYASRHVS
jgi:hypothetical protein